MSKPRKVVWLKNTETLSAGGRFLMFFSKDGLQQMLTLKDATLTDNAEFTAQIRDNDYGLLTTSAKVTVKGNVTEWIRKTACSSTTCGTPVTAWR